MINNELVCSRLLTWWFFLWLLFGGLTKNKKINLTQDNKKQHWKIMNSEAWEEDTVTQGLRVPGLLVHWCKTPRHKWCTSVRKHHQVGKEGKIRFQNKIQVMTVLPHSCRLAHFCWFFTLQLHLMRASYQLWISVRDLFNGHKHVACLAQQGLTRLLLWLITEKVPIS